MQSTTLTVNQYEFQTTIDLRTGSITRVVDPGLATAPAGRVAEFDFSVSVNGLPLGEIQDNKPDPLRAYVQDRLASLKPAMLKQFEDEFDRIATRHLGERGWMIDRVEIELGTLKFVAALYIGFELLVNYGAVRQSVDYISQDFTTYAVPFAKQITRQLHNLDPVSTAPATSAVEEPDRKLPAAALVTPAESEEMKLLKEIREQVAQLSAASRVTAERPGDQIHAMEAGPFAPQSHPPP